MKPGYYTAKAVDAVLGHSRNGTKQIEIVLQVGEETVSFIGYFTEKATPYTKRKMKAAGWVAGAGLDTIRGECQIVVREEDYDGRMVQKIDIVLPREGPVTAEKDRMKVDEAAAFLAALDDDLPF